MALRDAVGCPDEDRLAEYVDGVLTPSLRADVERHLLNCPRCRAVLHETCAFLATEERGPARERGAKRAWFDFRAWTIAGGALATAALLAVAVLVVRTGFLTGGAKQPIELQELLAALANEPTRAVDGRLAGDFKYAPPPSALRGAQAREVSPDVRIAAAKIEKAAGRNESAALQTALGVAYLAIGDLDKAIDVLEETSSRRSDDAGVQNDLSAAYFARGRAHNRPEDFPKALAAAERAIRSNPNLLEALFNRALALEALHLNDQARAAWQDYVDRDGDSQWGAEARLAQANLSSRPSTEIPCDASRLAAATDFSHEPWTSVSCLERVAQRELAGFHQGTSKAVDPALFHAATLLSQATKDPEALELARLLLRAAAGSGGARIADFLTAFVSGKEHYDHNEQAAATVDFQRCLSLSRADTSILGTWCAFYLAIDAYYRADPGVSKQFISLEQRARGIGSPELTGRCEWMVGLVAFGQGQFQFAVDQYDSAGRLFETTHDQASRAAVDSLAADAYEYIGNFDTSWRLRISALSTLLGGSDFRRRHVIFRGAARTSVDQGLDEVAQRFLNATVENARTWGQALPLVEALAGRADLEARSGRLKDAQDDLLNADGALKAIPDAGLARRMRYEVLQAKATVGSVDDPHRALSILDEILAQLKEQRGDFALSRTLINRAHVEVILGDGTGALADLDQATRLWQMQQAGQGDATARAAIAAAQREVVRELVSLHIRNRRLELGAAASDLLRARSWASGTDSVATDFPRLASLLRTNLPSVAVIHYTLTNDGLLIALIRPTGVRCELIAISESILARRITQWRKQPQEKPELAEQLHRLFLGRVAADLAEYQTWIIVPDGLLYGVPFDALRSPDSGRLVVEDHAIALAPSAQALSALLSRPRDAEIETPRVLVLEGGSEPGLPLLPAQHEEVAAVRAVYQRGVSREAAVSSVDETLTTIAGANVIHFAGHAIADEREPSRSRLLVRARDASTLTLSARDIERDRLRQGAIVVLAACRTLGNLTQPSDGPLGLMSAFIVAGARSVAATLSVVPDDVVASLSERFHEELARGRSVAQAMRVAKLNYLRKHLAASSLAWASFVVVGDPATRLVSALPTQRERNR